VTVVLSLVSDAFALQVSDRLLTDANTRKPLDPLANKSIVFFARNAVVAVAYTGAAYVRGQPTDEWIAEKLLGGQLARPDSRGAIRTGKLVDYHRDLGQSITAFCESADAAKRDGLLSRHGVEVVLVGLQWKRRGRLRPVMWFVSDESRGYRAEHLFRHLQRGQFHLTRIGSEQFTDDDLFNLGDAVAAALPDARATEIAMVEAIRAAAEREQRPVIGADCMAILIPAPSPARIHVRYLPRLPAEAQVTGTTLDLIVPAAFSPFVVGPRFVGYPSVIVGTAFEFSLGHWQVSIGAPDLPPDVSIRAALSSQPRPRF